MSISSRITQMEQHIGNAYDGLEDLGVDLTNVDKNIDNISSMLENVWNEYPKVTATDVESAMLEGTKAGRMEIDLKVQTSQETLTGRNFLPIISEQSITQDGITLKSNGDGSYTVSGTSTGDGTITFNFAETFTLPNSTLYWHIRNNEVVGGLSLYFGNSQTSSSPAFSSANRIMTSASLTNLSPTFFGVIFGSGVTVNMTFSPSIELTDSVTDYEEYCGGIPSPNPDYPQTIHNVIGSNEFKIQNKNLFDGEIELGSINPVNGTLSSNDARTRSKNFTKVKPNTTYVMTRQVGSYRWVVGYTANKEGITDGNVSGQASALASFTGLSQSFTTSSTTEYIKWYDTNSTDLTEKVQLEQGSTATSYVLHAEQNYPFTFAEGQRGMQGTTLQDNGIHNTRKQVVFDGSSDEEWTRDNGLSNTNRSVFVIVINSMENYTTSSTIPDILSSHFISISQSATWKPGNISRATNNKNLYIIMQPNMTLEQFKTWLSNNQVSIEYKLAEEETISYQGVQQSQYNAIKKAKAYDDITHISQTNDDLPFKIDIEALKGA